MTEESFSETYLFGVVDCSNGNYSLLTPLDPIPPVDVNRFLPSFLERSMRVYLAFGSV